MKEEGKGGEEEEEKKMKKKEENTGQKYSPDPVSPYMVLGRQRRRRKEEEGERGRW